MTPAIVAAFLDQVSRGQRAPLDHLRTLLIDWSATLASLPRAPGLRRRRVASRKHCRCKALVQKGFLTLFLVDAHCRLEAVMPCRHFPRRPAMPTHLELRLCRSRAGIFIVGHCRLISSFTSRFTAVSLFSVDSSRLISYPLPLGHFLCCVSSFSFTLLTLIPVLVLLGLVELTTHPWALIRFSRHRCAQYLSSRPASFGVVLTLCLSRATQPCMSQLCSGGGELYLLCRIFPQRGNPLPPGTADLHSRELDSF